MGEIKFRAWDKVSKMFVYFTVKLGEEVFLDPTRFAEELYLCTGLKDKDGKESYHKDIIKYSDRLYVMEWHDNLASWFLQPFHGGWHGVTKGDMSLMCEIIGNIYENPRLLEAK